jgi:hypothetical protein
MTFDRFRCRHTRLTIAALLVVWGLVSAGAALAEAPVFDVRARGAAGDGKSDDTAALNKAVEACAAAGGGQVVFPPGRYLTGTIHLKSNVTLLLDAGAEIVGHPDPEKYQNFAPPRDTPLASRLRWHRALLLGVGVENVTITGRGVINGNKVFDSRGEERMRGPHTVLFGNSKNITIRDVSIVDAANYAVMLEFTSKVDVRGVKITGGWDGVHFRGWKDNPCRDVSITDCQLFTGDDCIAGWYWEDTLIANCVINSSCNGIRLIGPAKNLVIHDCLFYGPGRFEHRSSRDRMRRNMLAGLCLQPGAWDRTEGVLDNVHLSDVTMHDVTTPLHFAVKEGNTVGRVTVDGLRATGVYRAAMSVEGWAKEPIGRVTLRDVDAEFVGGGTAEQAAIDVRSPPVDARPLPAWGLYARNVKRLDLERVRLGVDQDDARPVIIAEGVETLAVDELRVPTNAKGPVLRNVGAVLPTKMEWSKPETKNESH